MFGIKIEFMGFSTISISNIILSLRKNPIKSLGTIKLQPTSLELETVKVIFVKPKKGHLYPR